MSAWSGWGFLFVGVMMSIVANVLIKASAGYERLWIGVSGTALMLLATVLWGFCLKTLPLATAHVVWSGLVALFVVVAGIAYFQEPITPLKALFILMVLGGSIGLKVITK